MKRILLLTLFAVLILGKHLHTHHSFRQHSQELSQQPTTTSRQTLITNTRANYRYPETPAYITQDQNQTDSQQTQNQPQGLTQSRVEETKRIESDSQSGTIGTQNTQEEDTIEQNTQPEETTDKSSSTTFEQRKEFKEDPDNAQEQTSYDNPLNEAPQQVVETDTATELTRPIQASGVPADTASARRNSGHWCKLTLNGEDVGSRHKGEITSFDTPRYDSASRNVRIPVTSTGRIGKETFTVLQVPSDSADFQFEGSCS